MSGIIWADETEEETEIIDNEPAVVANTLVAEPPQRPAFEIVGSGVVDPFSDELRVTPYERAQANAPSEVTVSQRIPWGKSLVQALGGDRYKQARGFGEEAFKADSAREALHQAGLNFTVQLVGINTDEVLTDKGVGSLHIPERYAVVGSHGEALGIVSEKYNPLQPEQQVIFTDLLTDAGAANFAAAGLTKDGGFGSRMYTVVELNEEFYPPGMPDENVKVHILTTNSFDGGTSFRCSIVPTREICVNTMRVTYNDMVLSWSVRHSAQMEENMIQAREAIQTAGEWGKTMTIDAQEMLAIPMTVDAANRVFEEMIPVPEVKRNDAGEITNKRTISNRKKARQECFRMWRYSENLENVRGTAWGVMQGWGEWTQHGKNHRTPAMDRLVRDVHEGNGIDTSLSRVRELVLAQ